MTEVFAHPEHTWFWISAWRGEPADWDGVLGEYEAAVDWPACTFYEELMERHPRREGDPERPRPRALVRERKEHHLRVERGHPPPPHLPHRLHARQLLRFPRARESSTWRTRSSGRVPSTAASRTNTYAIEVFERHNAEVQRRVPEDRLLVYDVKAGWGPLCEFLGVKSQTNHSPARTTRRRCSAGCGE